MWSDSSEKMTVIKLVCCIFVLSLTFNEIICFKNNVCSTYLGYIAPDLSKSCYYSPDVDQTDTGLIALNHVEKVEEYNVETEDGYVLRLYRIPAKNPKGVVILQHSLSQYSIVWVGIGNDSFAYTLHRAGYDVWMPNYRGTLPSYTTTKNLTIKDTKYWDFSYTEIGKYDYPAVIRFVSQKTGSTDITFVGHSISSLSSLIYASTHPEEAKKYIKTFIIAGVPIYFTHSKWYVKLVSRILIPILNVVRGLGLVSVYNVNSPTTKIRMFFANEHFPNNILMSLNYNIACGIAWGQFDPAVTALGMKQIPLTIALKITSHFCQQIVSNKFSEYDYGKKGNLKLYGTENPPDFPLSKIQVPFYVIYADKDLYSPPEDNELLWNNIPEKYRRVKHGLKNVNHMGYFTNKNRNEIYFDYMFNIIKKLYE